MTRDPLEALLRLRQLTVDQARHSLADCLRVESQVARSVTEIEAAIAYEFEMATSLAAGDADVEAFAAWLRRIRPKQHAAHAAEAEAEAATAEARAVLAAARAAVRAAEEMLEHHAAEKLAEAQRRAQHEIDETGSAAGRTDR
jgi:flagellar export protein FliJ